MPELPEVETTKNGILPYIKHKSIAQLVVRDCRLRWPVDPDLSDQVKHRRINNVKRRSKYLLLEIEALGALLIHLGMSGSLRIAKADEAVRKHDHFDLVMQDGIILRYHDPRRFGCLLLAKPPILQHDLLKYLGPEPLSAAFNSDYLYQQMRSSRRPIKNLIMDAHVVVGVGNIYAAEALFRAGIHPDRRANRIAKARCYDLVDAIKAILSEAIQVGGTTLRDFVNSQGNPGYFSQSLSVYGREGELCKRCHKGAIKRLIMSNRSSFYCPGCQH